MSIIQTQTVIAIIAGVLLISIVQLLGRKGRLSFRYTVGWLVFGLLIIASGAFIPFATTISQQFPLSPSGLFAGSAVFVLTLIAIQLSISISGMQEQIRSLTEEIAILRHELEREDYRG